MNTALSDNHMHTRFSGDSEADEERMIAAAKARGLSGLTFTDHLDYDYAAEPHLFDLDLPAYAARMAELRSLPFARCTAPVRNQNAEHKSETYSVSGEIAGTKHQADKNRDEPFCVRFGIEIGLQPHLAAVHRSVTDDYSFDYVIGSVHQVDGMDPYYPDYFASRGVEEGIRRYYEAVLENLEAWDGFDALGHLDYILRYVPRQERRSLPENPAEDLTDAVLKMLIRRGIALEVNTGGMRSALGRPNPGRRMLERYRELGGELLTIGADAHRPEDVGAGIAETLTMLREIGFPAVAVYEKRKAEIVTIF